MTIEERRMYERMLESLKAKKPDTEEQDVIIKANIKVLETMLMDVEPLSDDDFFVGEYYEEGCELLSERMQELCVDYVRNYMAENKGDLSYLSKEELNPFDDEYEYEEDETYWIDNAIDIHIVTSFVDVCHSTPEDIAAWYREKTDFDSHEFIKPYTPILKDSDVDGKIVIDYDDPNASFKGVYISEDCVPRGFSNYIFGCDFKDYDMIVFGVADNATQVLEYIKNPDVFLDKREYVEAKEKGAKFVVLMRPIINHHRHGYEGWRWHKWGEYIGKHNPCTEYIDDDDNIDFVYVFKVLPVYPVQFKSESEEEEE